MLQYTGLAFIAAMQVLAVAFHQARQFDLRCFSMGSLLLQSCVLLESIASLESWYGREWWNFPRSASFRVLCKPQRFLY